MTLKQQIASGASLLGRKVTAVGNAGANVAGRVTSVAVAEDGVYLALTDAEQAVQYVPFANVIEVKEAAEGVGVDRGPPES